jgi:acyl-CoA reductase-like NAD-dependent aldehyde dehydrogenase
LLAGNKSAVLFFSLSIYSSKLDVVNPANGQVIRSLAEDDATTISQKFQKAKAAQKKWSQTSLNEKKQIIEKFGNLLNQNQTELATVLTR